MENKNYINNLKTIKKNVTQKLKITLKRKNWKLTRPHRLGYFSSHKCDPSNLNEDCCAFLSFISPKFLCSIPSYQLVFIQVGEIHHSGYTYI